jgi:hypothetical protein
MVLISIHPFALRKLVLIIAALLGFSALCFADPVLMTARYSQRGGHGDSALSVARQPAGIHPTRHFVRVNLER